MPKQDPGDKELPSWLLNDWVIVERLPLWMLSVGALIVAVLVAIGALLLPDVPWLQTVALILCVIVIVIPLLPHVNEVSILGVNLKVRRAIETVQQRQILNRVVTTVEVSGTRWFQIDESGNAHPLPDPETAQFLAGEIGIVQIDPSELKQIRPEPMPSFKLAVPMRNERDIFILYHNTLYYQSSLSNLYKLATWQGIDFESRNMEEWGEPDSRWMQDLSPEDFAKCRAV